MPPWSDRSHILTEQRNPRTMSLHAMSVEECVEAIQREDRAVPDAVERAASAISGFISAVEPGFVRGGRLIYVGAGTSGRLGVLDASEAPPTFCVEPGRVVGVIAGGDRALKQSSEGKEDEYEGARRVLHSLELTADDAVLGIAAGGTTPYVLGALRIARARTDPPVTGLLVCTPVERPRWADHLILVEAGPEVLTGSTRMKAGTATKLVLNTISTTLMVRSGRVYQNLMVDLRPTNAKLRDRAVRIVSVLTGLGRSDAEMLLARACSVKTAVVMHRLGLAREMAEGRLATCGGRLDLALGETPPPRP